MTKPRAFQNVPYTTAGAEPKCATPRRISGQAFSALSSDEFACPPEIVSAPRYVEAEAGKEGRECISVMKLNNRFSGFFFLSRLLC